MSLLEDLRSMEDRVKARIAELEPQVAELDELRALATRMGLNTERPAPKQRRTAEGTRRRRPSRTAATASSVKASAPSPSSSSSEESARSPKEAAASKPKSARSTTRKKSTGASRKPGAKRSTSRADDVARLVRQQPGVTVPDLGKKLSVDSTSLYRVVRKLESEGQLTKQGAELHPVAAAS